MNENTLTKVLKNTIMGGLMLSLFIPLYVANDLFFPFITGKAFAFRIIVEIVFALWIVLMFSNKQYAPKFTWITGAVTALALVSLAADLLGVSSLRSIWSNFERMEGWLVIVHLWAYFMVLASVINTKKLWHVFLNVSLVSASITAIYGIVQFLGWATIHQSGARLDASLGNSAYMGVYMLFHVGLAMYMYFVAKKGEIINANILKWVYPVLALVYSFIIFETQTRGTILGLIGGVMVTLALYAIFGKKDAKKSRIIAGSIIGVIILAGILFWANRDAKFIQGNETLQRLASIDIKGVQTQARGYVWPMAIKGFTERPILGWGQENFNYIFNANYAPEMYGQEQWFDRAHSVFLDWLVASGALGFLVYISLYVLAIMAIWKSDLSIAKKSVLVGTIVAYTIHNIFVFDNLSSYIMFFAVLAFANSFKEGKSIKWLGSEPVKKDVLEYVAVPIVLVLLAGSLYFVNIRVISANSALIDALRSCQSAPDVAVFEKIFAKNVYTANQEAREQLLSCAANVLGSNSIPGPTKQAFFALTQTQIEKQIATTPSDARMYVLGGAFYNNVGAIDLALPTLEKAYELSPKKQSIAYQLASVYLGSGEKEKAEAILKEAYEVEKTNYEAKQAYIIALILNGKEAAARKEFTNDISLFENSRVAEAYMSIKQYEKGIALFKKLSLVDPKNVEARMAVAQSQYVAGQKWADIETLKVIQKDFPEYTEQINTLIKQTQAQ